MNSQYIKVNSKATSDTFGCTEEYFKKFIKHKPLLVLHETPNHYVRVEDENKEEWGVFPSQYALVTGIGSKEAEPQAAPKQKKPLPEKAGRTRDPG